MDHALRTAFQQSRLQNPDHQKKCWNAKEENGQANFPHAGAKQERIKPERPRVNDGRFFRAKNQDRRRQEQAFLAAFNGPKTKKQTCRHQRDFMKIEIDHGLGSHRKQIPNGDRKRCPHRQSAFFRDGVNGHHPKATAALCTTNKPPSRRCMPREQTRPKWHKMVAHKVNVAKHRGRQWF